jgi:6,7-dimethyl-8-ribityllumazine synthase
VGEKGATPDLDGDELRIAIVVARFNEDVTKRLLRGAQEALRKHSVDDDRTDILAHSSSR